MVLTQRWYRNMFSPQYQGWDRDCDRAANLDDNSWVQLEWLFDSTSKIPTTILQYEFPRDYTTLLNLLWHRLIIEASQAVREKIDLKRKVAINQTSNNIWIDIDDDEYSLLRAMVSFHNEQCLSADGQRRKRKPRIWRKTICDNLLQIYCVKCCNCSSSLFAYRTARQIDYDSDDSAESRVSPEATSYIHRFNPNPLRLDLIDKDSTLFSCLQHNSIGFAHFLEEGAQPSFAENMTLIKRFERVLADKEDLALVRSSQSKRTCVDQEIDDNDDESFVCVRSILRMVPYFDMLLSREPSKRLFTIDPVGFSFGDLHRVFRLRIICPLIHQSPSETAKDVAELRAAIDRGRTASLINAIEFLGI
jgi:hypothetical protein